MNKLLFDGLIELEEIRSFEEFIKSPNWSKLNQEQIKQKISKYAENKRNALSHF